MPGWEETLARNAMRGEIGWSGSPGDGKAMAGDEKDRNSEPAAPKDESGKHSNNRLNEVGQQSLKEEPADKDLNPASGNESSVEDEQPDQLWKSIVAYARRALRIHFPGIIDGLLTDSCKGNINQIKMVFRITGVEESAERTAGLPESRAGFFSQLLKIAIAKENVEDTRREEVDLKTAATREAEIGPFPGEGGEVLPKSTESL